MFLFGLCFGSFGNVLICRLPKGETLGGRSHCPTCGSTLRLYDLIPLISFCALRGKCRTCPQKISWQYPLVELATGILFVLPTYFFPQQMFVEHLILGMCLWLFFIIAIIDARIQGIPDVLNMPLLVLCGIYTLSTGNIEPLALVIGIGFLGLQWIVSGGSWIGSGDIILIASIALLLGQWKLILLAILLSYMIGAVFASTLLLLKIKGRKDALAFAPFLTIATYLALFWGEEILRVVYEL